MSDSSYCVINYKNFRYNSDDIQDAVANHEFTEGKKVKIVHKTVQAWLPEADFKKPEDLRDMHDYEFIPMPNVSEITGVYLSKCLKSLSIIQNMTTNFNIF